MVKVETTQDEHTRLLQEILKQAKTTNGSVARHDLWIARAEGAKAALGWVQPLAIALVAGGVVAVFAAVLAH